jgi:predicted ATP-grasp superfamily ATP-dependent carboligase
MQPVTVLGYSVRALAQSAAQAGYLPYAIDAFADQDLAACCHAVQIHRYPGDFQAALAAAPPGPWMYTGGLENYPALIQRLSQLRPLWGNAASVVRQVRRPEALAHVAREAACRFPALYPRSLPALVKPRRGSGGMAIRFASDHDLLNPLRGCYLQEYIAGQSASAAYVAASGRARLLGATQQLLGSDFGLGRPFLYAGSIGPLELSADQTATLERVGDCLARQYGLAGLFNVDLVLRGGEIWLVEVNPRYSASMEILKRARSVPLVAFHAAACTRGELPQTPPALASGFFGKAIVYAQADGEVPATLDAVARSWLQGDGRPAVADIPRAGEKIFAGQPVVTVFASGPSASRVLDLLRGRIAAIQGLNEEPLPAPAAPPG